MKRVLVAVVAIGVFGVIGAALWFTWDRSTYAPGYSEAGFHRIQPGMPRAQVESILGRPLREDPDPQPPTWWYGEEGLSEEVQLVTRADAVVFEDAGKVERAVGNMASIVRVGMSEKDVLTVAGEPGRRTPGRQTVAHYSVPSSFGKYRARIVAYNARAVVVEVIAFDTFD